MKSVYTIVFCVVVCLIAGCGGGGSGGGGGGGTSGPSASTSSSSSSSSLATSESLVQTLDIKSLFPCRGTSLTNGNYLTCWEIPGTPPAIGGQIYTSDGSRLGSAITIATGAYQMTTTALTSGGFAAVWVEAGCTQNCSAPPVYAQAFDSSGRATGNRIVLSPFRTGVDYTAIAGLADGKFVIAQANIYYPIILQVYNADGTPFGQPFTAGTTDTREKSVLRMVGLSNGTFALTWCRWCGGSAADSTMHGQVFNSTGGAVSTAFEIPLRNGFGAAGFLTRVRLTSLPDGGFAFAWQQILQGSGYALPSYVEAQIFNSTGSPTSPSFQLVSNLANYQGDFDIAGLSSGNLAIAWIDGQSSSYDCAGATLKAATYSPLGVAKGLPVTVNTPRDNSFGLHPQLFPLQNGGASMSWNETDSACPVLSMVSSYVLKQRLLPANSF